MTEYSYCLRASVHKHRVGETPLLNFEIPLSLLLSLFAELYTVYNYYTTL